MFTRKTTLHPSLLSSDLGATVPVRELELLDRYSTTVEIDAGTEIMGRHQFGRECFVVIDGEFRVQLDDGVVTAGPGSVLGELSLLTRRQRTASVTATTDSIAYVLTPAEFETVLGACPKLARHVLDGALRRALAA